MSGDVNRFRKLASVIRAEDDAQSSTTSPLPALTVSVQTTALPLSARSALSRLTTSSFSPVTFSTLRVETTVPVTIPSFIVSP